ncbi:MAG: hypothetical protein R3F60_28610 [bacterium]
MAEMIIIEYREKAPLQPPAGVYVLVFEITCKVTNDLFLLAPQIRMVDLLTGIPGPGQQRVGEEDGFAFDFDLYNYYFMSNHLHLLLGVVELVDKSLLLEWVCREIASESASSTTGRASASSRTTPSRSSRRSTPWTMRYFMGQATAELKSRHPADDVFACANPALLRGELRGTFVRGDGRSEELTVRLDRLPGLGELTPRAQGAHVGAGRRHRRRSPPAAQKAGLPVPDPEAVGTSTR